MGKNTKNDPKKFNFQYLRDKKNAFFLPMILQSKKVSMPKGVLCSSGTDRQIDAKVK